MINNEGIAALVVILREQTALLRQHTQLLESILQQLERLQSSTVGAVQPTQPSISSTYRYERNIKEFPDFDWASISCSIVQRDRHQYPTVVQFNGAEYTRRNKDDEIWFSRKTPQGYDRLIKFGKNTKVRSLSEDIREVWEG